ncbi:MAG TPA: HdeD family acid-resistance protein [Terriglobales bacterium]|nr:HdeD family acid-resistance protein [Terriglobales bacterium]
MAQDRLATLGSGGSIVWAVLLIVFGFLAIALPLGTSLGVVLIVAWLIVLSGGFQFIHAFQSKGAGSIAWKLLVAVAYLIAGIYFLLHPLLGLASFTLALAFFFVAEGVMDLIAYFQNRSAEGSGWILFDGIVTLILGILVWRHWPSTSGWVIGTLVGISMVMTGTTRLMISLAVRRLSGVSPKGRVIDRVA